MRMYAVVVRLYIEARGIFASVTPGSWLFRSFQ